jgi:hypothetical protein
MLIVIDDRQRMSDLHTGLTRGCKCSWSTISGAHILNGQSPIFRLEYNFGQLLSPRFLLADRPCTL